MRPFWLLVQTNGGIVNCLPGDDGTGHKFNSRKAADRRAQLVSDANKGQLEVHILKCVGTTQYPPSKDIEIVPCDDND